MTESEVIERFCILSTAVGKHFHNEYATDCFCYHPKPDPNFRFEEFIINYIEEAVKETMEECGRK